MAPTASSESFLEIENLPEAVILRLNSKDGMNRLSRNCVATLTGAVRELLPLGRALILAGNDHCFSAGADLNEVKALGAVTAAEFARSGQELMSAIERFPAPVIAAISGHCMGGGLDLALACHWRIAAPNALFGHRGAALGLVTGWGGTQRLPRLVGKARALQMLVAAEKISASQALAWGLVAAVAEDPVAEAIARLRAPFT